MLNVKCRACEALHWINGRIHSAVLRSVEMCQILSKLSSTTLLHLHGPLMENAAVRLQHTQIQVWFRDPEYGNGVRYNRDSKINRAILSRLIGMMYCVNPFVPLYWRAPTFCRHVIDVKFVIGNGGWCALPNCFRSCSHHSGSEAGLCTVYIPGSLLDTPLWLDSGDVGVNLYLKCRYCRPTGRIAHPVAPGSKNLHVLNGLQSIYRIAGNMCIHFLKGRV